MSQFKKCQGFTLIEIMIVVGIVGILAAIAYPSYMESVRKSKRAEAKSELSGLAQQFQRCYTLNGKYNLATNCSVFTSLDSGGSIITNNGDGYYEIKLSTTPVISATAFQLVATAIREPQTKDTKDGCNILRLNQNGVKLPAACW